MTERDTEGPADAVDDVTSVMYELMCELMKVTGQIVVDTATVEVTTATDVWERRGQSVTLAGQLKTVTSLVA